MKDDIEERVERRLMVRVLVLFIDISNCLHEFYRRGRRGADDLNMSERAGRTTRTYQKKLISALHMFPYMRGT